MRKSLEKLISNCIALTYKLPKGDPAIPKIKVSTCSDECYQILSSDRELAEIIYNGIVDYSFNEADIDLTKLDTFQKRALKSKLYFNPQDKEKVQLKYGFYGEVLLFLMLQFYHKAGTFISRGFFYSPLEKSETKGFDTYQMLKGSDDGVELWFGEVKFHKNFRTGITQILDKIKTSLSDEYLNSNFVAMEDKEPFVSTEATISPVLNAFRENPEVNLARVARENGMSFVYPMLVIFDNENKSYDDIIKSVVKYTNERYEKLEVNFSLDYSIFFMFLPVNTAMEIKKFVRSWILSNQPVI